MARRSLSALGQLRPWTPACMWWSLAKVMGFVPQVTGDASARGSDGSGSGPANLRFPPLTWSPLTTVTQLMGFLDAQCWE